MTWKPNKNSEKKNHQTFGLLGARGRAPIAGARRFSAFAGCVAGAAGPFEVSDEGLSGLDKVRLGANGEPSHDGDDRGEEVGGREVARSEGGAAAVVA